MSDTRIDALCERLKNLLAAFDRPVTFMEVCGTHTVAIFRSGLRSLLPEGLRLLSGPGCPVCVTDQADIDRAVSLAERDCILLTYGDMMRVPGSSGSLLDMKGKGARVEVVTSAVQAVETARENPADEVVFLGVGFETTAPATAVALQMAQKHRLSNFSVLCLHKAVPPVMRALCADPAPDIDGFILPGNVTVVAGLEDYAFLTDEFHKAAAAAGFDPLEILGALVDLTRQVGTGDFRISTWRLRDAPKAGNAAARKILAETFAPCDAVWRGLGRIPFSGYRVAELYARYDAAEKFGLSPDLSSVSSSAVSPDPDSGCRCGAILSGRISPPECGLYGTACTPVSPVGPCMVSSEGTCSAWYRYR